MKFRMTTAVVALVAIVAAGCGGDMEGSGSGSGSSEASGGGGTTVSLETQEDSGITGEATIEDDGGKSSVELTLEGAGDGKAYAAHVHEGTCDDLNPTPAFPLEDATGGGSSSTVDVEASALQEKDYAINVHDADDPTKYVACGNIDS